MIKRNPMSMKPSASRRDWNIREHTTHYACKEVMDRDGGKAVGCCCTGHNCKPIEPRLKYFSLFSGVGGFEQAIDGECVGFSEVDKHAISVYKYHYPEHKNYGDIKTIEWNTVSDFDLVVGGSPCQDLSVAGKQQGLSGARSGLFYEYVRCLKEKQPTNFIWENVKGSLSSNGGRDFATIQTEFSEAGYDTEWQVLNAKDFGVPQNRERVFVVGHLRGKSRPKVFPITREVRKDTETGVDEQSGSKKFIKTRHLSQNGTLISDAITLQASEIPFLLDTSYPGRTPRTFKGIAPTVRDYGSGGNKMPMVNGIRRLTPIECERLMSWPDNWTKFGKDIDVPISDTQRYKMCGNGVVTDVVRHIINKLFNNENKKDL